MGTLPVDRGQRLEPVFYHLLNAIALVVGNPLSARKPPEVHLSLVEGTAKMADR